jgi:hypothetical protein
MNQLIARGTDAYAGVPALLPQCAYGVFYRGFQKSQPAACLELIQHADLRLLFPLPHERPHRSAVDGGGRWEALLL